MICVSKAIALILHGIARNPVFFHLGHECVYVVAHEIEFMHVIVLRRMHRDFRWRQSKDQPSVAGIDVWQFQDVAQKSSVCFSH